MIRSFLQLNGRQEPGLTVYDRPSGTDFTDWGSLRKSRTAPYDTTNLTKWIAKNKALGSTPIVGFGPTPSWATTKTEPYLYPPDNLQDWVNYVYDILNFTKGQTNLFDMANEFDQVTYWRGDLGTLGKMQDVVYTATRGVGRLIGGGDPVSLVSEGNGIPFLRNFIRTSNKFDICGVHVYPRGLAEIKRIPEMLRNVRSTLDLEGLRNVPIAITECGIMGFDLNMQTTEVQIQLMEDIFGLIEDEPSVEFTLFYAYGHVLGHGMNLDAAKKVMRI